MHSGYDARYFVALSFAELLFACSYMLDYTEVSTSLKDKSQLPPIAVSVHGRQLLRAALPDMALVVFYLQKK